MSQAPVAAVIVLAAGGGTRMKSKRSKLLHEVGGHSMLSYAVDAARATEPEHLVVVVGHEREQVLSHLEEIAGDCRTAVQEEQLGTGHAVQCGLADLPELTGQVVVTYGDVPMLSGDTLVELVTFHREQGDQVTVLTAHVGDPTGYGRVVRGGDGQVQKIVEHRDADDEELRITEINSGIYVFEAEVLRAGLAGMRADNDQGELYLTDVIAFARTSGGRVGAYVTDDVWQTEGVNDRVQLARMNAEVNRRIVERAMRNGVTVIDPATTWIHDEVDFGRDVTVLPGSHLFGATSVRDGAVIGPDTTLQDCEVGEGASVVRSHCLFAVIGPDAQIGPFSYLRPNTVVDVQGKIGAFVETKNTRVGPGAKVPHLTYAGDAEIGEGANIGAGTIFANYDGVTKSRTVVGRHSFVGSDSVLVAPVTIADGAYVAAGSAVIEDVGPGELAIARGHQRNVPGWVAKRRAGTATEQAALDAEQAGKDNE